METTWNEEFATKARSGSKTACTGSSCAFIRLTDKVGLKLYATKLERDASYVALSIASEHNLACKVWDCIEMECPEDIKRPRWWPHNFKPKTLYGFLCETVDVQLSRTEAIYNLQEKLDELFSRHICDIREGNVGYRPDGTLVAIDIDGRMSGLLYGDEQREIDRTWGHGFLF